MEKITVFTTQEAWVGILGTHVLYEEADVKNQWEVRYFNINNNQLNFFDNAHKNNTLCKKEMEDY